MSFLVSDPLVTGSLGLVFGLGLLLVGFRRLGRLVVGLAIVGLYLLATPLVAGHLLAALESGFEVAPLGLNPAPDAIVVLSANVRHEALEYDGDTVGDLTLERMRYGAVLHERTGIPILVTGGIIGYLDNSIARLMADIYAAEFGLETRWIEGRSVNTFQNAAFSRELLEAEGIDRIYLVTHAWHMRRAAESFEHVGFKVVPAPTGFTTVLPWSTLLDLLPRANALRTSGWALHEGIGLAWYRLKHF